MCGRFALDATPARLIEHFQLLACDEFAPRYNIAPLQFVPVIRERPNAERVGHLLRWGLLPSWIKEEARATKPINARAETLAERPSFRAAYKARRCLIPASGFYEWATIAGGKQPYYIHPAQSDLFAFAGLWERWTQPDGQPLDTFTVVTTAANEKMRALHERMPVIVAPVDYDAWLSRDTHPEIVHQLLQPCAVERIAFHPVSKAVGNVRHESPELIVPLAADSPDHPG